MSNTCFSNQVPDHDLAKLKVGVEMDLVSPLQWGMKRTVFASLRGYLPNEFAVIMVAI